MATTMNTTTNIGNESFLFQSTTAQSCYGPTSYSSHTCHCGDHRAEMYENTVCQFIKQDIYEKTLAICLLLYGLMVIAICIYWLFLFWSHRDARAYRLSLMVRRPIYMIISYAAILPCILFECISSVYLYWNEYTNPAREDLNYWTDWDGTPIIFTQSADLALHLLFWFGFWWFAQLKIFKFGIFNLHVYA